MRQEQIGSLSTDIRVSGYTDIRVRSFADGLEITVIDFFYESIAKILRQARERGDTRYKLLVDNHEFEMEITSIR